MTRDAKAVEDFRDRIEAEFGLVFDAGRKEQVEESLLARSSEMGLSARAYVDRLGEGGTEWERIAALLTVPESYFFRHSDQLRAFADVAVPERMAAHPEERSLRILSAGCANGEEPYTLSIALQEHANRIGDWSVSIEACDINPEALHRAKRGVYTNWALRAAPPACRSRYFEAVGNRHRIRDEVRRRVSFAERNVLNLYRPEDAETYDIVFFRNVLIYFSPEAIRAGIDVLAHLLAPGGYLFLGPAETLRGISSDFVLCHTHDAFYYRRKRQVAALAPFAPFAPVVARLLSSGDGAAAPAVEFPWAADSLSRAADPPISAATEPAPFGTAWMNEIERSSERIRGLHDGQASRGSPTRALPVTEAPRRSAAEELQHLLGLLGAERYKDVLEGITALPEHFHKDPDIQLVSALAHLNRGQTEEAEKLCHAVLARDSMNGSGHYILALCREHSGDLAAAGEHDRVAIYLDPAFAMPHMHLALMARRSGNVRAARREFENANLLLARESASRVMMFGGGFTREALREICRRELRALGGA